MFYLEDRKVEVLRQGFEALAIRNETQNKKLMSIVEIQNNINQTFIEMSQR